MSADVTSTLTQQLKRLHDQKTSLELEAEVIISELETPPRPGVPPMGVKTPLVDAEGYPRADINVYRARELRGRLFKLKTDHSNVSSQVERLLVQLSAVQRGDEADKQEMEARGRPKPKPFFDKASGKWVVHNWDGTVAGQGTLSRDKNTSNASAVTATASQDAINVPLQPEDRPFARVNSVETGSPAEAAGLLPGDLITSFGDLTIDTPNVSARVTQLVSTQLEIRVVVARERTRHELRLRPQAWGGRGLIGCHIIPIS